jgi:DNA polymerase III epsilon subunit-like protein
MSKKEIIETARRFIAQNCLILDTETTGLGEDDQIVEIAIIDAEETLEFSSLVRPSKPIPEAAKAVHGISDTMVERAPSPEDLWSLVHMVICGSALLAYNADFDSRLIVQTFGPEAKDHEWHCLMDAWMRFHGLRKWMKLDDACLHIGIPVGGHRAMGDAKAAREVLRWLARQEV